MRALMILLMLTATACRPDETLSGFADASAVWQLAELDGQPFTARATLRLPEPGQVAGHGPCNSFGAALNAPYPRFALGPIRATRMACADLDLEATYFAGLAAMTLAEVAGDRLILSDTAGRSMVFRRQD